MRACKYVNMYVIRSELTSRLIDSRALLDCVFMQMYRTWWIKRNYKMLLDRLTFFQNVPFLFHITVGVMLPENKENPEQITYFYHFYNDKLSHM